MYSAFPPSHLMQSPKNLLKRKSKLERGERNIQQTKKRKKRGEKHQVKYLIWIYIFLRVHGHATCYMQKENIYKVKSSSFSHIPISVEYIYRKQRKSLF